MGESEDRHHAFRFVRRHGPSKRQLGELGDDLPGEIEPRLIAIFRGAEQDSSMGLGKLFRLESDGATHDHRIDVQTEVVPIALVAAHVGGNFFRFNQIRIGGLARHQRDTDNLVSIGNRQPVAIDDRFILHADGVDRAAVLAETDHQPWRRNGFGNPHSHQTEISQIPPWFQRVLELDRLRRREGIGLQSDQLDRRKVLNVGQHDCLLESELGGVKVFFDVNGRDIERGADVVETESDVVGRKAVCEVEIKPEQVADGVVIFLAVQPPDHDRWRARLLAALGGQKVIFDPANDPVHVLQEPAVTPLPAA